MEIIGWLIFGLIVGALAKLLMPGDDPGGWIATMLLGVAGAVLGGYMGRIFFAQNYSAGWIMAIVGSMPLLVLYRIAVGGRRKRI